MRLFLAPMEGVVDHHFRTIYSAIGGVDICVSEFVATGSQVRSDRVVNTSAVASSSAADDDKLAPSGIEDVTTPSQPLRDSAPIAHATPLAYSAQPVSRENDLRSKVASENPSDERETTESERPLAAIAVRRSIAIGSTNPSL